MRAMGKVNPNLPAPGDLLSKSDHTALVFKVYPPGQDHPRASDASIPIFPGDANRALWE